MNKQLEEYARKTLKEGLSKCTEGELNIFARMYSHENQEKHYSDIVDDMDTDKLDWAMTQVQNSLDKNKVRSV